MPVRSAAKSGMTELSTQDHGKRRNDAAHAAVLVSGYELARHFGCSRQNVDLLAQQGMIERSRWQVRSGCVAAEVPDAFAVGASAVAAHAGRRRACIGQGSAIADQDR